MKALQYTASTHVIVPVVESMLLSVDRCVRGVKGVVFSLEIEHEVVRARSREALPKHSLESPTLSKAAP